MSKNLNVVRSNTVISKFTITGNKHHAKKLNVVISDNWTDFGVNTLQHASHRLSMVVCVLISQFLTK